MQRLLLTIMLCGHLFAMSQMTLQQFPADLQLYGRDRTTNTAIVPISGFALTMPIQYDSLRIDVLRNDILIDSDQFELVYINDTANFTRNYTITAELSNYTFRAYGVLNNTSVLIKEAEDVVAGDAFIISGQSNAEARQRNESTVHLQNDFIRVYASGTPFPADLQNISNWYLGQGDGNRFTHGNVGQWGMQFAHRFVNELQVPVAIFNGAHPAQPISFFQAPSDYATSLNSNYGRMYNRVRNANLQDHIRAVFWSQGEKNGLPGFALSVEEYKEAFDQLMESWNNDFNNIEQFYIFQTANTANRPDTNIMRVKEAQHQLAVQNSEVTTIPTNALTQYTDSCHFDFTNGYEEFGNRLYNLVRFDLYGLPVANNPSIPNPTVINYLGKNILEIETGSPGLWIDGPLPELIINDGNNTIENVELIGSRVKLTLSNAPSPGATVSYFGPGAGALGNHIWNASNLEMLCFYEMPVHFDLLDLDVIKNNTVLVYPNPVSEVLSIAQKNTIERLIVLDLNGKTMLEQIGYSNDIDVSQLESGMYLLEIITSDNGMIKTTFLKQ